MHFSYDAGNEKSLLVNLQGVNYNFHDPEIAITETLIKAPSGEEFFCTGNLRQQLIIFCSTLNAVYFVLN